ncbi:hypothetical protein PGTUg99_033324 [Puccinia graminis f. sp. tritici]|uniref:Uncharacterized protein n=1 Tax=Puccinia graminis f. sp. tritici TaxID=56615 RepID=A0A5B0Q9U2_PUCGR|nr:hypothetical protein PGTUg99_033324 [Puccinia graminis f. sp. tritici]
MTLNENGGLDRRLSNSPLWLPSSAPFSRELRSATFSCTCSTLAAALSSYRLTNPPIYSSSTHPASLTAPSSYQQSPKSSATHLHSQVPFTNDLSTRQLLSSSSTHSQLPFSNADDPPSFWLCRVANHQNSFQFQGQWTADFDHNRPGRSFGSLRLQVSERPTSSAVLFGFCSLLASAATTITDGSGSEEVGASS